MPFCPITLQKYLNEIYGIREAGHYVVYYISCKKTEIGEEKVRICRVEFIDGIFREIKSYAKISHLILDNGLDPNVLKAYLDSDNVMLPTNLVNV